MPIAIRVLLALALLAAAVTPAVFVWRYRRWPPYVWKRLLRRRIEELIHRRRGLQREAGLTPAPVQRPKSIGSDWKNSAAMNSDGP